MPLTGPTPADWIAHQGARQDENMRMMMQMAMAAKQFEQQQTQQQRMYEEQLRRDDIAQQRADAYDYSLMNPRPAGPTDLMRNYEFMQQQYPGQDVGPMILPNMKPQNQTEGYQYGIDPETAAMIERDFRLPAGTVGKMGARQQADVNQQWLNRRFPKPDTNTPASNSPASRQTAVMNTLLQDIETRRSADIRRHDAELQNSNGPVDNNAFMAQQAEYDRQVGAIRGGLMAIAARGQELSSEEWDDLNKKINTSGGGYSQMAQEIAEEMGISPEQAEAYIKKATAIK
jgi:hypothetical protein